MTKQFSGTGVAIVTPFKEDKSIDFNHLEKIIEHTIDGGVDYIVSLGTTGESVTLENTEKKDLIDFTKSKINNRVKFVVGIGGNNTQSIINQIQTTNLEGVDGILSVSPYYNKPSQEGIYQHYKAIAESTDKSIILYNVPGRTGSNVKAETTIRLANDFKNIIAMKEASGDFDQAMQLIKDKPEDFTVLSGEDALTMPFILSGMDGVISVVANVCPNEFSSLVNLCLDNEVEAAQVAHYRILDLINALFMDGNPAGIKEALKAANLCENHVRLPLVPVNDKVKEIIQKAITEVSEVTA